MSRKDPLRDLSYDVKETMMDSRGYNPGASVGKDFGVHKFEDESDVDAIPGRSKAPRPYAYHVRSPEFMLDETHGQPGMLVTAQYKKIPGTFAYGKRRRSRSRSPTRRRRTSTTRRRTSTTRRRHSRTRRSPTTHHRRR